MILSKDLISGFEKGKKVNSNIRELLNQMNNIINSTHSLMNETNTYIAGHKKNDT